MLYPVKITEEIGHEICNWRYEGVYSVYDLPSYETLQKKNCAFTNPEKRENYTAYLNKQGKLIGYTGLVLKAEGLFLGIGVRPEDCSKGYGKEIIKLVLLEVKQRYPKMEFYLDVRSWNKRAICCYEACGFRYQKEVQQETSLGTETFIRMVYCNRSFI